MSDGKKKLSFLTVISTIICVVFVCEAAAPAAAIGNQQFFWWIFLILTFLLPYGMVVAELGTTYDGEGGIYDWVRDGLGDKWGARISYYYWVNYPLWIASLATMFPDILGMVFGVEFNLIAKMGIELAFVWIVYLMGRSKAADSEWVLNGGAIIKVAVAVIVGALGIWYAMENGFANDMSAATFLPELTNTNALGYLSIIIFNFMGFEVICTMTDDMADPARDIPKAIIAYCRHLPVRWLRHRRRCAGRLHRPRLRHDRRSPDHGGRLHDLQGHLHRLPDYPVRQHGCLVLRRQLRRSLCC